jgi:hypothetical protein
VKELKKEAAKKGVWLEHRTKGNLPDASRTYWLVGAEELETLLPTSTEEKRIEEVERSSDLQCPHADLGCPWVAKSRNSLNAHLKHCKFKPGAQTKEPMTKAKKVAKTIGGKSDRKEKKQKTKESGEGKKKAAERKKRASQKAAPKVVQHMLLKGSSDSDDECEEPAANLRRALASTRVRARRAEPEHEDPQQNAGLAKSKNKLADAQQVMHSFWWCGGDCACVCRFRCCKRNCQRKKLKCSD